MDAMKPGTRQHGPASCKLSFNASVPAHCRAGVLEVRNVFTPAEERGKGHASALLRNLCAEADATARVLLLMPKAYDEGGLENEQLVEWYRRFGFEEIQQQPVVLMARRPGAVSFKVKPLRFALGMEH